MRSLLLLLACGMSFVLGGLYWERVETHLPVCFLRSTFAIVDGDTIRCEGRSIRLAGFDAPESRPQNARCNTEVALGEAASCALGEIVTSGGWRVVSLRMRDSYGRLLAELRVGDRNVQDLLIERGFAEAYDGKGTRPDWCSLIAAKPELRTTLKCPPR